MALSGWSTSIWTFSGLPSTSTAWGWGLITWWCMGEPSSAADSTSTRRRLVLFVFEGWPTSSSLALLGIFQSFPPPASDCISDTSPRAYWNRSRSNSSPWGLSNRNKMLENKNSYSKLVNKSNVECSPLKYGKGSRAIWIVIKPLQWMGQEDLSIARCRPSL